MAIIRRTASTLAQLGEIKMGFRLLGDPPLSITTSMRGWTADGDAIFGQCEILEAHSKAVYAKVDRQRVQVERGPDAYFVVVGNLNEGE